MRQRLSSQPGQDMVEWAGVLLIVCIVIAGAVALGLAGRVSRAARCDVQQLLSGGSPRGTCGAGSGGLPGGAGSGGPTGGAGSGEPRGGPRGTHRSRVIATRSVASPHVITAAVSAGSAATVRPKDCHKLRIVLSPSAPNITCLGQYSTVALQLTFRGSKGILAWGEEMRYKILRAADGGTILAQWQVYENGHSLEGDGCAGGSIKERQVYHSSGCALAGGNYYTFEFNFYALNARTHTIINVTDITRFYVTNVGNPT